MAATEVISLFSQLLFPVAVSAFLLWERGQSLEKIRVTLAELQIAIYLLLEKMDAIPEYKARLEQTRNLGKV